MARQKKQPRSDSDTSSTMIPTAKRVTRSLTRLMKSVQQPSTDETKTVQLPDETTTGQSIFVDTLVVHQGLFFDRLVPMLSVDALASLCTALGTHHAARDVLQDDQRWRYVTARDALAETGQVAISAAFTRTVACAYGCQELTKYLSLRSQWECFAQNVVVLSGDLEHITHIGEKRVDCLAFPTSASMRNPGIGVASCVHRRAGPELDLFFTHPSNQRRTHSPVSAVVTPGYQAGVHCLIHCVGPSGMARDRRPSLYKAYISALEIVATTKNVHCAAFASISTGTLRYPVVEAAEIAMLAVKDMMRTRPWPANKKIGFVCIDKSVLQAFQDAYQLVRRQFFTSGLTFPTTIYEIPPP